PSAARSAASAAAWAPMPPVEGPTTTSTRRGRSASSTRLRPARSVMRRPLVPLPDASQRATVGEPQPAEHDRGREQRSPAPRDDPRPPALTEDLGRRRRRRPAEERPDPGREHPDAEAPRDTRDGLGAGGPAGPGPHRARPHRHPYAPSQVD